MRVQLYSAPGTLIVSSVLKNPTFRFVATNELPYHLTQITFHMEIDFEKDYPICFYKKEARDLIYIPIGFKTPFSDKLKEQWPEVDPNSIVLRSSGYGKAFKLESLGLDGFIRGEVSSLAELYNELETKVGDHITRNMNMLDIPDGLTEETFMDYVTDETPYQNENVQYILDNRYQLTAYECAQKGESIKCYNREQGKNGFLLDYEPSLSFEMFYETCTPAKDKKVMKLTEEFYTETPEKYKYLENVVMLDNFNIWTLEPEITYKAQITSRLSAQTSFGDTITFRIEKDEFDGIGLIFTLKTGEEFRMDDMHTREFYNSPMILVGEARQTAIEAGSPIRNLLDQKHGMRE